jgi:hypothetical protein
VALLCRSYDGVWARAEKTLYCHKVVEDAAPRFRTVFRILDAAVGERRERMIPPLSRMPVRIVPAPEGPRGGLSSARSAALMLSNVSSASESRHVAMSQHVR